jgi:hypothetical protein
MGYTLSKANITDEIGSKIFLIDFRGDIMPAPTLMRWMIAYELYFVDHNSILKITFQYNSRSQCQAINKCIETYRRINSD